MNDIIKFDDMPQELVDVLKKEGFEEGQFSNRYSDLYAYHPQDDRAAMHRAAQAGNWRAMSKIFKCNITGRPCLEVGLALLSRYIRDKARD